MANLFQSCRPNSSHMPLYKAYLVCGSISSHLLGSCRYGHVRTQRHAALAGRSQCLQSISGQLISGHASVRTKATRGHPLAVHATLSTRARSAPENHSLLHATLVIMPFWFGDREMEPRKTSWSTIVPFTLCTSYSYYHYISAQFRGLSGNLEFTSEQAEGAVQPLL